MIKKTLQSEFVKSIATLMTGTVVAQMVAYLAYPIITRIYSEADVGELGIYTRLVAFIAAFATARYEVALPIPKQDTHAFQLYRLSFRIAFTALLGVTIVGIAYFLMKPYELSNFAFLFMTVVSAYIAAWINLGTTWSIRKKEFKKISIQRMVNSFSVNGLRVLFGYFSWGSIGLIFATLIGSFLSIIVFVFNFIRLKKHHHIHYNKKRMRIIALEYKQFPIVNLPHVLIDLGVDLGLSSLIVLYYGKAEFGLYSHAYMMLKLPISVVGQSIGQVFFNKCSDMVNKNQSVYPLVVKTLKTLFLLSIIPFTVLFFWGEPIFGFVFGAEWSASGKYAEILVPYLMMNFILSPISSMPLVLGRQKEMFMVGIFIALIQGVIFGLIPLLFPGTDHQSTDFKTTVSFEKLLWYSSLSLTSVLIFVFYLYLRYAKIGRKLSK